MENVMVFDDPDGGGAIIITENGKMKLPGYSSMDILNYLRGNRESEQTEKEEPEEQKELPVHGASNRGWTILKDGNAVYCGRKNGTWMFAPLHMLGNGLSMRIFKTEDKAVEVFNVMFKDFMESSKEGFTLRVVKATNTITLSY